MTWTPERDETLRSDWATGFSTAEIGRRMGLTKNAVIGRAHRLGLPARQAPIKAVGFWTPEREAQLQALYGGRLTAAEIAEVMGTTLAALMSRAQRLGLSARGAHKIRQRQNIARPSAGRGLFSQATRPATTSRPRAGEPGAAASTAHCPSSFSNSPEVVTPPRVFLGRHCCWIGDEGRSCDAPVQANARGLPSSYCPDHFALCLRPPMKGAPPPLHWRA